MSRPRIVALVALLAAVAVILVIWKPWAASDPSTKGSAPAVAKTEEQRKTPDSRDFSANFDVLADDDAQGSLRLEGIVLDSALVGVAGVVVTLGSNPPRVAVSGEDGTFFFDKLMPRPYRLVGRGSQGATAPVSARLTETSDPVTLHLRPSSSVEVTVRSALDRKPVSGATVEIRGALSDRATSDDDGVARLSAVPAGRYQVAGWSQAHATARSFLRIASGTSTYKVELLVAAGSSVSGRVVDDGGAAVAGARVLYASSSERFDRAHPRFDAVISAEDGSFAIPALAKGTWRLTARHKTMAPGTSEPLTLDGVSELAGVEIKLDPGAVVSGKVVMTDGLPGAGSIVRASPASRGFRGRRPRQTFADDQGHFELEGLAKGDLLVVALHESASSETKAVDTTSTQASTNLVLELGLSGRIAGRVVDSAGEPIEGAQVRLMPDFRAGNVDRRQVRQDFRLRGFANERSDAGGRFEFRGLRDGEFRVSAAPPGSQQRTRGPAAGGEQAQPGDLDVEIVLEARGSIKGKVAFANGDPAGAFSVATGAGFRSAPIPFAEDDGSFVVGDLEPRTYRLAIRGPSFDNKTLPGVAVEAGKTIDVGTVVVKAGRRVSGRVTDSNGAAVENATVTVGRRVRGSGSASSGASNPRFGGSSSKTATTDANGEFAVSGVGETELAVVAEHPSKGRSRAISLPSSAQSSVGLSIALEPPGSLDGRVTINGAPGGGVRVTAQSKTASGARFSVSSGEDGVYRFDVLAPDSYLVYASLGGRRGFGSISKSVTVETGKSAALNLNFVGSEVSVAVTGIGPEDGLSSGIVSILDSPVVASTARELEAFIAARDGGFSARGLIAGGDAARFEQLTPGTYSICVIALPPEVFGRAAFGYVQREGKRLAVVCVESKLDGTGERTVSVPVIEPEFVAPPSE